MRAVASILALCVLAPPACGLKPRLYERLGEDPAALWRSFRDSGQSVRPGRPVKLSASLYYFGKRRKNRTTISLWGRQGEVMRLDVRAGVGSLVSAWLERPDYFLAYFPGEKTAYASRTPLAGQAALGLPFPFTLLDLAAVAGGRLDALLPQAYDRAEETVNGVRYFFEDGAVSSLSLDKQGRLQAVQGREPWPYELELGDYPEEDDGFARKLSLRMDEASALLRVKSLEHRVEPWPEGAVGLDLPEGTRIMWIDESALEAEPEF